MCNCQNANQSAMPMGQAVKQNMAAMSQPKEINKMDDQDMVLITYMSPNRGQHPVRGHVTRTFYGHRAGGGQEKFLVHRSDIAAQPQYFVAMETRQAMAVNEPAPRPVQEFNAEEYLAKIRNRWNEELDLQALPGVNAQVALNMKNSGFTTRDAILRVGAEGLADAVKGLGQIKAEAIVAYLESVNAD